MDKAYAHPEGGTIAADSVSRKTQPGPPADAGVKVYTTGVCGFAAVPVISPVTAFILNPATNERLASSETVKLVGGTADAHVGAFEYAVPTDAVDGDKANVQSHGSVVGFTLTKREI